MPMSFNIGDCSYRIYSEIFRLRNTCSIKYFAKQCTVKFDSTMNRIRYHAMLGSILIQKSYHGISLDFKSYIEKKSHLCIKSLFAVRIHLRPVRDNRHSNSYILTSGPLRGKGRPIYAMHAFARYCDSYHAYYNATFLFDAGALSLIKAFLENVVNRFDFLYEAIQLYCTNRRR